MKLFLDSSVQLAAAGSAAGVARAIFDWAPEQQWTLLTSPYADAEVARNLPKLPPAATSQWMSIRGRLAQVEDIVAFDRPVIFEASKDRPILYTAFAYADALLTLDSKDFGHLMGANFYGLPVLRPYEFLVQEYKAGRLRVSF